MKLLKYLCIGISALSILSCSDWTSEEREVFENQEGMHRLIPLIEAQTEEDLTPTMREYFAQIREYRKTPHVKGFGWFGNWTGKGNNVWGIERSGFFNGREKWAKGFENQRV